MKKKQKSTIFRLLLLEIYTRKSGEVFLFFQHIILPGHNAHRNPQGKEKTAGHIDFIHAHQHQSYQRKENAVPGLMGLCSRTIQSKDMILFFST
jgi:hypothetical protein